MSASKADIHFEIRPDGLGTQIFNISCRIAAPDPGGQRLDLPAWTPGSYLVRDFAGQILRIEASCGDVDIDIAKLAKTSWRCEPCDGVLEVRYQLYANDLSVRGAHLDSTHGFFNGPLVYLRVSGHTDERCTVALHRPDDSRAGAWQLATSLRRADVAEDGFGTYEADDYEELIDHPVEMGVFDTQHFEAYGIAHRLVVTGRHNGDLPRVGRDLKRICETQIDFFGQPAPIDRYLFLLTVLGEGYGGLEHRWSSALHAKRDELPRPGESKISEAYRRFLGLASHEYFHLWNVKRIRPAAVAESDYIAEAYTRDLWIFEGITSYYDDMMLQRSGVIDDKSYYELLGNMATIVYMSRGRFAQSLADSSYDAWIKLYKRDDNAPNTQISYYTKGALTALGLDLLIRKRSEDRRSLDDVMRLVWQRHGAVDVPLPEGRFEEIAAEVAGVALGDYFDAVVRGVEDPPLARLFEGVGLRFETAPVRDGERKPMKREPGSAVPPAMQIGTRADGNRLFVTTVYADGPAQRGGVATGDELVAIDGIRVTAANLNGLLERYTAGQSIGVDVFRRDELHRLEVELDPAPDSAVVLSLEDDAATELRRRRRLWLEGRTRDG